MFIYYGLMTQNITFYLNQNILENTNLKSHLQLYTIELVVIHNRMFTYIR